MRAKEGKLHGLQVTFSKDGQPSDGSLFHEAEETGVESIFKSRILLQRKVLDDKMMSGKFLTTEPMNISVGELAFSVIFMAPFQHEPKPALEVPAAEQSLPGKDV